MIYVAQLKEALRSNCFDRNGEFVGLYKTFSIPLNAYIGNQLLIELTELENQLKQIKRKRVKTHG
ncbi:hypothetical protein EDC14_10162 [Hydrogenispora ethanolica]|uniref:Uncharacterized protein n=1 Tax=Hydrogenispora ethanolica TaxID=1082276 RepID=A0A4R1RIE6_HYDET|nr:hypothetical protein [Hydrogenispora ethanolica]TCL65873.1 hypothetical protein EDC14_10162 [Hydrogenispora ethanolica]